MAIVVIVMRCPEKKYRLLLKLKLDKGKPFSSDMGFVLKAFYRFCFITSEIHMNTLAAMYMNFFLLPKFFFSREK